MRAQAHMAPAPVLAGGGPAQRIMSTLPPPFSVPARFLFVDKPMSPKHGAQRE
ncbi:unnamed protein product [Ectocarpus sp. 8 AP-2014]